jgi:biopolymer transport protein ExbD
MKFPRNARIFRGHLDAAPFAGVFFCLLIFVLLASLVYTPGVALQLPAAGADLPGVPGPTLAVAMDLHGQLYFQNWPVTRGELRRRLEVEVKKSSEPLTLVILADKRVTVENLDELIDLGRKAGITSFSRAMQAGPFDPADPAKGQ